MQLSLLARNAWDDEMQHVGPPQAGALALLIIVGLKLALLAYPAKIAFRGSSDRRFSV
jgi:hypothetical protein